MSICALSVKVLCMANIPVTLCDPPHKVTRPEQVKFLRESFERGGWSPHAPDLVGYTWEGRVQLLSGSHRLEAAKQAGMHMVPVRIYPFKEIYESWGDLNKWKKIMQGQ